MLSVLADGKVQQACTDPPCPALARPIAPQSACFAL